MAKKLEKMFVTFLVTRISTAYVLVSQSDLTSKLSAHARRRWKKRVQILESMSETGMVTFMNHEKGTPQWRFKLWDDTHASRMRFARLLRDRFLNEGVSDVGLVLIDGDGERHRVLPRRNKNHASDFRNVIDIARAKSEGYVTEEQAVRFLLSLVRRKRAKVARGAFRALVEYVK